MTEEPENFHVIITRSDINFERTKSATEDIKEGIPVRHFVDDYFIYGTDRRRRRAFPCSISQK